MGPKNIKAKQAPIHTGPRCNKPHKYKVGPKAPIFGKILFNWLWIFPSENKFFSNKFF